MTGRRSLYFTFQGLLTAALLALFMLNSRGFHGAGRLLLMTALLVGPMIAIQAAREETLGRWWFQTTFFMLDATAATIALYYRQPAASAYLVYFFIIFGTALTRSFKQSLTVGIVSCGLYIAVYGHAAHSGDFWLRLQLLIITTTLLSLLSLDAQKTQREAEARYRERLIQSERLATLGRVAAEVAHRIKAPLTTIRVNAEVLSHKFARTPEVRAQLSEIEEEVERCKEILKALLDLGRIEEMDLAPMDLREPVTAALRAFDTQMKGKKLRLETRGLEAPLPVLGDRSLLQEALKALLQNAVEACEPGGRVVVLAEKPLHGRRVVVRVEDDGRGIVPDALDRVFHPFFTTKGTEGSGLGLSAALRIVQKHGGTIEAYSGGAGRGARFDVSLPAGSAGAAGTSATSPA